MSCVDCVFYDDPQFCDVCVQNPDSVFYVPNEDDSCLSDLD